MQKYVLADNYDWDKSFFLVECECTHTQTHTISATNSIPKQCKMLGIKHEGKGNGKKTKEPKSSYSNFWQINWFHHCFGHEFYKYWTLNICINYKLSFKAL